MSHLFFTTSIEWRAYYDYWNAMMYLYTSDILRQKKDPTKALILERGLTEAAIAKALYKLNQANNSLY